MSSIPPAASSPSLQQQQQQQQVVITSDRMVPQIMQTGLEKIVLRTAAGFALGGLAGIVLARGGAHSLRKGLAGFGGGLGLGSAWTQTSIRLQDLLEGASSSAADPEPDK
jgi:hypothetical protein